LQKIKKEILIEQIELVYRHRIEFYKEVQFDSLDRRELDLRKIILLIIGSFDELLGELYSYRFTMNILDVENQERLVNLIIRLESLFVQYLISVDRNYVIPLIRAKEYAIDYVNSQEDVELAVLSSIKIISDLKKEFVVLLEKENDKKILNEYISYLSMGYILLSLLAFNYNMNILIDRLGGF